MLGNSTCPVFQSFGRVAESDGKENQKKVPQREVPLVKFVYCMTVTAIFDKTNL